MRHPATVIVVAALAAGCDAFSGGSVAAPAPSAPVDGGTGGTAATSFTTPIAFITKAEYPANLQDAAKANASCAAEAKGKLAPPNWVAWVAFSTAAPTPAVPKGPWSRPPSGRRIADSTLALQNGILVNPLNEAADGTKVTGAVWTGLTSDATTSANCEDWTSVDATMSAAVGDSASTSIAWLASTEARSCDQKARLYCFEAPATP